MNDPARKAFAVLGRLAVGGLVFFVRAYQATVSPFLGPCCRYTPTCSQYAIEALGRHGVVRGLGLSAWRILRCHPFARGGCDPVPPAPSKEER